MTYRIVHYNPYAETIPHWRDLRGRRMPMPAGWAFLADVESEMPHRETTIFLGKVGKKSAKKRRRREAGNTAYTYAGELKPYLEFLQWLGIAWAEADQEVLFTYIDLLCQQRHWFTGEQLDTDTLDRRVRRVAQAYGFTNRQGITDVDFDQDDLLAELWEALDAQPDGELGGERRNAIRFIGDDEWDKIGAELGPMPSTIKPRDEGDTSNRRPSGRNRLLAELAITTGMRACELVGLPLAPFLAVVVDDANLHAWTKVTITDSKGGLERPVFVANQMVREIQSYAAGGRAWDVTQGGKRGTVDPGTVFVNGADTGADAGRAMRAQHVSNIFRDAVRRALPTSPITIRDANGERVYARPAFRLHDCRHTFALRLFNKLVKLKKEPWDIIQGRLGHKKVSTTRDIYLDMSRTSEPFAADLIAEGLDQLIYA